MLWLTNNHASPGYTLERLRIKQTQKSWRRNTSRISHPYISHSQYIQPYSRVPSAPMMGPTYTPSPLTIHTASFSCPKRVDLPTYTPPTHNTYNLFLVSQPRPSPHIRIPLTIHTTLFSATQPRSPHIHPLQSKYIQPHSRVPSASISPHTLYPKEGRNKRSCARNLMVIGATDASMSGNLL